MTRACTGFSEPSNTLHRLLLRVKHLSGVPGSPLKVILQQLSVHCGLAEGEREQGREEEKSLFPYLKSKNQSS